MNVLTAFSLLAAMAAQLGQAAPVIEARGISLPGVGAPALIPTGTSYLGWTSLGCYQDTYNGNAQILSKYQYQPLMTFASCSAFCTTGGYKFMGMSNGQWCYCDNQINLYAGTGYATTADKCNLPCAGDPLINCGAYWTNSMFELTSAYNADIAAKSASASASASAYSASSLAASASQYSASSIAAYSASAAQYSAGAASSAASASRASASAAAYSASVYSQNAAAYSQSAAAYSAGVAASAAAYSAQSVAAYSASAAAYSAAQSVAAYSAAQSAAAYSAAQSAAAYSQSAAAYSAAQSAAAYSQSAAAYSAAQSVAAYSAAQSAAAYSAAQSAAAYSQSAAAYSAAQSAAAYSQSAAAYSAAQSVAAYSAAQSAAAYSQSAAAYSAAQSAAAYSQSAAAYSANVASSAAAYSAAQSAAAYSSAQSASAAAYSASSSSAAAAAAAATSVPSPWTAASVSCVAEGTTGRALSGASTSGPDMTYNKCLTFCGSKGFSIAGVEYGSECYCGNSLNNGASLSNTSPNCNMACAGSSSITCGGPNALTVFVIPAQITGLNSDLTFKAAALPSGWTAATTSCVAEGTTGRALTGASTSSSDMTGAKCATFCAGKGFPMAGVEYGSECYCGSSLTNGASLNRPSTACNMNCAGDATQVCGGPGALTIYTNPSITPAVTTPTGPVSGTLPAGWSVASSVCIQEVSGRALTGASQVSPSMTIGTCLSFCQSKGFQYAGIEYGSECYCGNSLVNGASLSQTSQQCSMPCSGDSSTTCGGPNSIQLFTNPSLAPVVPVIPPVNGYSAQGCIQEVVGRALTGMRVDYTDMTIEKCTAACAASGFKYAGVEYGQECYCGNTLDNGSSLSLTSGQCYMSCPGNSSEKCGGPDAIQIYSM